MRCVDARRERARSRASVSAASGVAPSPRALMAPGSTLPILPRSRSRPEYTVTQTVQPARVSAKRRRPCGRTFSPIGACAPLALDRRANEVARLGPRAVVVFDVAEAEQVLEHEPRVAGALADPAVGDGGPRRDDVDGLVDPPDLF